MPNTNPVSGYKVRLFLLFWLNFSLACVYLRGSKKLKRSFSLRRHKRIPIIKYVSAIAQKGSCNWALEYGKSVKNLAMNKR